MSKTLHLENLHVPTSESMQLIAADATFCSFSVRLNPRSSQGAALTSDLDGPGKDGVSQQASMKHLTSAAVSKLGEIKVRPL